MFDRWHNHKFNTRMSNIPTWRLMQELTGREILRPATAPVVINKNKGVTDVYGCPLLQQFGDDGLPLFVPRD